MSSVLNATWTGDRKQALTAILNLSAGTGVSFPGALPQAMYFQ